jgi:hypothetical protein
LPVKREATPLQLPNDLSISESGKPAHSRRYHDHIVATLTCGRQVRNALTFTTGVNQLAGNVTRDIERLGNGSSLRHETL